MCLGLLLPIQNQYFSVKYQPILIPVWCQHAVDGRCPRYTFLQTVALEKPHQRWYRHLLSWNVNYSHLRFLWKSDFHFLADIKEHPISILRRYVISITGINTGWTCAFVCTYLFGTLVVAGAQLCLGVLVD